MRVFGERLLLMCTFGLVGCSTMGSYWIAEPPPYSDDDDLEPAAGGVVTISRQEGAAGGVASRSIGVVPDFPNRVVSIGGRSLPPRPAGAAWDGKVLGKFRNTYYDFPQEAAFAGEPVALRGPSCEVVKQVPRGFYEAVCVQGSGRLTGGSTVSFHKRGCSCAEVCPRTGQKICFDELPLSRYPWGRGATGRAITPLLTVATDPDVIPMNTPLYIPQYDGAPRDPSGNDLHDGCFIAQDQGMKVKGKHVDVFTGTPEVRKLWNRLVPSNEGVTVVLDSPRCARAAAISM